VRIFAERQEAEADDEPINVKSALTEQLDKGKEKKDEVCRSLEFECLDGCSGSEEREQVPRRGSPANVF